MNVEYNLNIYHLDSDICDRNACYRILCFREIGYSCTQNDTKYNYFKKKMMNIKPE